MRLERVIPAVAIVLSLLVPATPMVAADDGPSVTIVSPTEGERIRANARVSLDVSGFAGFSLSGHFALDGAWAGNVSAFVPPTNGTTRVNGTLNATSFAPGTYELTAVLGDGNDTVTSAGVTVILNAPPTLSGNATYDLDERALHLSLNVGDDSGVAPIVRVRVGSNTTNASFLGQGEIVMPLPRETGNYTARVEANDSLQNATLFLPFEVANRKTEVDLIEARYIPGGLLRVEARFSDPDGPIVWAAADTAMGSGNFWPPANESNETNWSATFPVDPELGEHTGYITTRDAWGGVSVRHFSFTIAGAQEVVYERLVETQTGAYVDLSSIPVPLLRQGTIEICMVACAPDEETVDDACRVLIACRSVDSPWALSPLSAFRFCRPDAPSPGANAAAYLGYAFHSALDNATSGALCGTKPISMLENGTAFVSIRNETAPTQPPVCEARNADVSCAYESYGGRLSIAWAQAPETRVVVRISGVRL